MVDATAWRRRRTPTSRPGRSVTSSSRWDYDVFADASKARRAGFHEYVDTEAMFLRIFQDLRDQRLIP